MREDRSAMLWAFWMMPRVRVFVYFGPSPPEGYEQNWIPTTTGCSWFTYFRLYGPLEPYFDRSWRLPDIEKVR